jgi:hypothetical protein
MKRLAWLLLCLATLGFGTAFRTEAVESVYVGAQVGATGPLDSDANFNNAFGGGLEVGFYANPIVELRVRGFYVNMAGTAPAPSVRLLAGTLSAEFHLLEVSDIEFLFGGGPGFYHFNNGTSESVFGLQGGVEANLKLDEGVRFGFGLRVHAPLSANIGSTLFSALVSVGYQFGG